MSEKHTSKKNVVRELIDTIIYIVIIVFLVCFVLKFVGQRTVVNGSSMENTLYNGENLILDKLTYRFSDPQRYDIVVFPGIEEFGEFPYYIKRIIGLPGETVQIKDGYVYINDKKLESDIYSKDCYISDPGSAAEPIVLGKEDYFCLGDNREVSRDSRFDLGVVKRSAIIGKVEIRFWPLNRFGYIDSK